MNLAEFLKAVVTSEKGWLCLAFAEIEEKTWKEEFYWWPDDIQTIQDKIETVKADGKTNIYFSPHLFSERSSLRDYVIPNRTIVADLDDANVLTLLIKPTILVQTSEDRHQGYWIVDQELNIEDHMALSSRLTYSIPRCDRSGWWVGHKFRVPDTYNYKYVHGPQQVKVVSNNGKRYRPIEFDHLPNVDIDYSVVDETDFGWTEDALKLEVGPRELLASLKASIPGRIIAQYNTVSRDRSAALWALMMAAFRAGLDKERVFILAYNCANNKFKELRYGGIKELGKDVLRAERASKLKLPDIKDKIRDIRSQRGEKSEKSSYISRIIREYLEGIGAFHHTNNGQLWYIREDTGKPIPISMRSEQLLSMLEVLFGINGAEQLASYVCHHLMSHASELPPTSNIATLTYYDLDSKEFFMHTGRREVLKVSKESIEVVNNGYNGIIFPWSVTTNIINPQYKNLEMDWADHLLEGCLYNVVGVKPEHAKAILKIWFMTVLLKDGMVSRPILALFGQPGSGKSTLIRRIYALLYGKERSVNAVTKEDDFDYAVSNDPLVVLDNVDTWARWLPDKLALSASSSEIVKRKLFTDNDVVLLRRQAMVAVTAHAPKFGREDVTDRLLLLNFERLQHFVSETQIIERIIKMRNALWGGILTDIQAVFNTPKPRSGWPQFRVEDFASFGYHIATACGIEQDFADGLESIRKDQKSFILAEDQMLVDTLVRVVNTARKAGKTPEFEPVGRLWLKLIDRADDESQFTKRYQNAITLGKKLWTLHDALKTMFDVEIRYGKGMSREWKFSLSEATEDVTVA